MATTQQKWKNLATLIIAKAEHKRKFNELIVYKEYQYIPNYAYIYFHRSLKENIEWIKRNKIGFYIKLRIIIGTKFEKYMTERKITIPKLDDINEYNCETDCPVCFETIGDNTNGCMEGDNCNHTICSNCRDKIVEDTNKCPICREILDDNHTGTETETENESVCGDNERPTTDLFYGRRWYNVEENRIETYNGEEWRTNNNQMSMSRFIVRYTFNSSDEASPLLMDDGTCCIVCGIQRTPEVFAFMNNIYPEGYTYPANIITDGWGQTDYFDDEGVEPYLRCYDCQLKFHLLQGYWTQN